MSFSMMIMKFKDGEPTPIERETLEEAMAPHGHLITGEFGLEMSAHEDLFEYASIMGDDDLSNSGILFNRPSNNRSFYQLVFDLLSIPHTYFFDQDMEFAMVRNASLEHLPSDVITNLEHGLIILENSNDIDFHLKKFGYL